jgi:hypothetical protein
MLASLPRLDHTEHMGSTKRLRRRAVFGSAVLAFAVVGGVLYLVLPSQAAWIGVAAVIPIVAVLLRWGDVERRQESEPTPPVT